MEQNITYFEVATERVCLEQMVELPIETDFSLPDYLGEIKKVLKCTVTPYLESKQLATNTLTATGTVMLSILYLDPKENLFCAEQEIPFQKTIESAKSLENGACEIVTEGIVHSCRAVTERRFSVKGSLRMSIKVTATDKTAIVSDIDCPDFEQLRGEAAATTPLGISEKTLIVDEEITIPENFPSVHHILRNEAFAQVTDCKIVSNKVIVKGQTKVTVLYRSVEGTLQKHTVCLPFNQIVDLIGITELCNCEAKVSVCGLSVSTRTSQNGECRNLMVICRLCVAVSARCDNQVPVLFDLYSTRFATETEKNEVDFTHIVHQSEEQFLCKKRIPISGESEQEILDLWCVTSNTSARNHGEGITICGGISICALTCTPDNRVGFFERVIDFDYPLNLTEKLLSPVCHPDISVISCDYKALDNGEIELVIELAIRATVYDTTAVSLITSVSVDETKPLAVEAALIAYFADRGENVWEISKNFFANRSELLELNHLSDEIITQPKMLLIPRM